MKRFRLFLAVFLAGSLGAFGDVSIDDKGFGARLGGWNKRGKTAAEYAHSGASYRTYRPEITPTPDGGIFVSLRIDHVRGWLASDDHAVLEITVGKDGTIVSAQSSIGQKLVGVDRAVQIGTDLVADLSAKMLREKIVEAGRVSFPAVLRHNYNLLYQSIQTTPAPPPAAEVESAETESPPAEPAPAATPNLEIKPFGEVPKVVLPTGN
jgi:hypothetical protein